MLKNLKEREPLLTNISNTEEATLPSSGHFLIKHIFNAELPNKSCIVMSKLDRSTLNEQELKNSYYLKNKSQHILIINLCIFLYLSSLFARNGKADSIANGYSIFSY